MAQNIDHAVYNSADCQDAEELDRMELGIHVSLTYEKLIAANTIELVKSPKAGAVVVFLGCTRASFDGKTVTHLKYSAYVPLALRTLIDIAREIRAAYPAIAIAIVHRLGRVNVSEESIIIAVSSAHRATAFAAGEVCLERVKNEVEIWKEEWFADGGLWRANKDGKTGVPI
ncbi:hypothetical protein D6C78_09725 [Aureobasidium pullulans]|uniref:Uncharacterized protein n=1 Tax=Aureobasidium pullulans TaxID=5580 RepID=A0A4T0B9B9_AURPU|nr:hypothetical protein D6C78_09725 [Aureobasidium pullulans]